MPFISTIRLTVKSLLFSMSLFNESGEYQNNLTISPSFAERSFAIQRLIIISLPAPIPRYKEEGKAEINEYGVDLVPELNLFPRYVITGADIGKISFITFNNDSSIKTLSEIISISPVLFTSLNRKPISCGFRLCLKASLTSFKELLLLFFIISLLILKTLSRADSISDRFIKIFMGVI